MGPIKMLFTSDTYIVRGVKAKSKARYAKGVKVGDEVYFVSEVQGTNVYSLSIEMYLNGVLLCVLSRGDLSHVQNAVLLEVAKPKVNSDNL